LLAVLVYYGVLPFVLRGGLRLAARVAHPWDGPADALL
jgi:hypothetical protein